MVSGADRLSLAGSEDSRNETQVFRGEIGLTPKKQSVCSTEGHSLSGSHGCYKVELFVPFIGQNESTVSGCAKNRLRRNAELSNLRRPGPRRVEDISAASSPAHREFRASAMTF